MGHQTKNLRKARRIRSLIASEFGALQEGRITLSDVLRNPQAYSLARCRVYDVLRRSPHLGPKGAKKILLETKVWPLDHLDELQLWQRDDILSNLPPRAR